MSSRARLSVALCGCWLIAAEVQAHHAVASVYDLNKEIVLEGELTKVNFRNPHSNLLFVVPNADGTSTEWVLTTASLQVLTRAGVKQQLDQARRGAHDHGATGEERQPCGVHAAPRARRPQVRSRHRLTAIAAGRWGV